MDETHMNAIVETENPAERQAILYLLSVVIASGMENNSELPPNLNHTLTSIWEKAGHHFDEVIAAEMQATGAQPTTALKLALMICQLKTDTENEPVYQWLRGDGPILLSRIELQQPLDEYFATNEKAPNFARYMGELLNHDMSQYKSPEEAIESPTCFLVTATIFFGLHLKNLSSEIATALFNHARTRVNEPKVWATIEHFRGAPATAWIVTELEALKTEANE
jgi:hypothetical protein